MTGTDTRCTHGGRPNALRNGGEATISSNRAVDKLLSLIQIRMPSALREYEKTIAYLRIVRYIMSRPKAYAYASLL